MAMKTTKKPSIVEFLRSMVVAYDRAELSVGFGGAPSDDAVHELFYCLVRGELRLSLHMRDGAKVAEFVLFFAKGENRFTSEVQTGVTVYSSSECTVARWTAMAERVRQAIATLGELEEMFRQGHERCMYAVKKNGHGELNPVAVELNAAIAKALEDSGSVSHVDSWKALEVIDTVWAKYNL